MLIRGLVDEDFVNYKKASMLIVCPYCNFKCNKEAGQTVCHNSHLIQSPLIKIEPEDLVKRYLDNPITSAIVFGGLEPFYFDDDITHDYHCQMLLVLDYLRRKYKCMDDVIIYTGYTEEELAQRVGHQTITTIFQPIVVKYGRYLPGHKPHFDSILGVQLASPNQYAKRYD